ILDSYYHKKEPLLNSVKNIMEVEPVQMKGSFNFIFLLGVVFSVAFLNVNYIPAILDYPYLGFIREAAMLSFAGLSIMLTNKQLRIDNKFTWGPIIEVAFLFLGIFATMVPALLWLNNNAGTLGIDSAAMFYYATGGLSAFLDNAPTALAFHNLAIGMNEGGVAIVASGYVAGIPEELLTAISVAAVFFGAMTYIGNGPNFMVKAIAEENKIDMPSFFGYMFKFSFIVLLPVYILTQLLFI
ncbi:MAG: sodium:proton antiporter, partial [Bacteroidales bacterium]|nr:sodium:proton antiporter [Bacteroidales bacterium]